MKSQCLPFSQIPHTAKLFLDYLSFAPQVQEFYPRSPRFNEWFKEAASDLQYDSGRSAQVCGILARQNRSFAASAKTLENIERMKNGAAAMVTGQQVGLFGGPLFSIFKALTAIKLADEASRAGVDCVPIFWLATEDHDLAEINHVIVPSANGSLETVGTAATGVNHSPVGSINFGPEIEETVRRVSELLGESEINTALAAAYRSGETFGSAFGRLFAEIFSRWGVILLDASDPDLHRIAEPIYRGAVERCSEIEESLQAKGRALEAAGYDRQVKVTASSTLLFMLKDGARVPVHRRSGGVSEDQFVIGDEKLSKAELLSRISSTPEDFSPNVLLRPVVQDFLLPTLAYAGGAAEIAYFAQAAAVYETLLGKITPIVPRFSATLVEHKQQSLLERHRTSLQDVFVAPELLKQRLASSSLPQALSQSFEEAEATVRRSMTAVRESLGALDKTLVESASTAESKILYQLAGLRSKAARAELRHEETLGRHADLLSNSLYPNTSLQEREIAGVYFLAHYGTQILEDLYQTIHPDCLDHQVVTV